jgi:hypothetical protein
MRSNDNGSLGNRTDGVITDPSAFVLTTEKAAVIGPAQAAGRRVKTYNSDATPVALCNEVFKVLI